VPAPAPQASALKLFDVGTNACGIIAVGTLAQGVVAIGINAVGVVAIGVNAMGVLCAVGVNALGLVGVSAVNSIAVLALSLVNSIGGFGGGLVNGLLHPVLGLGVAIAMGAIGLRLNGRWLAHEKVPLVRLLDVLAAENGSGWARAKLLAVQQSGLVVGDADGQHTLETEGSALAQAREMLANGQRRILVHVAAEHQAATPAETGYRTAAERAAVLRALELRTRPRRLRLPASKDELGWIMARGLYLGSALGLGGSLAVWALRLL
jgi:hypothetical protein